MPGRRPSCSRSAGNIAQRVRDKGVRVQALLPGATRTEIWERSGKDVDSLSG